MSFFVALFFGYSSTAASMTGEQVQLGLVTLLTFLILSMLTTWMFKKWVKINNEDEND
jgi:membrane protein implicated in regulation of membrane protease activity